MWCSISYTVGRLVFDTYSILHIWAGTIPRINLSNGEASSGFADICKWKGTFEIYVTRIVFRISLFKGGEGGHCILYDGTYQ